MIYYTCILASQRNGTLYIGVTNDLKKRVYDHKTGKGGEFTREYGVDRLVYFEMFDSVQYAIMREKRLKKWNRSWKIRLIEEINPMWMDLFDML
jgi:putative endonuclease